MGPKKGDRTPKKMTGAIPDASYLGEKYDVVVEGVNDSPQKDEVSMEVRMAEIAQNQEFARRTEKLVTALDEKNRELEKLAVVVESITPLPGMDPEKYLLLASGDEDAPDFRDGKIVALAKKTRKLTEALRKEKGLATKLMRENESLEKRCAQIEEDKATVVAQMQDRRPVSSEETEVMMEELRKLRKDNKASSKTIDELKRKVHEKEQRMKAMERTLVKELGDAVDMEKAMAVDSGWRGRAQQIVMLKNKIRRLEQDGASLSRKLDGGLDTMSSVGPMSTALMPSGASSIGGSTVGTNYASVRTRGAMTVDAKAEKLLNDMSETRSEAVDGLVVERDALSRSVESYKKKLVARDARISAMESDMMSKRENLRAMVNKADGDNQLIGALKQEISRLRSALQAKNQEVKEAVSPPRIQMAQKGRGSSSLAGEAELTRLKRLVQQLTEQIETQDDVIRQLRTQHK